MENEIWKDIEGYPDYQVSNLGRVKSLRFNKERIMKSNINPCGYYYVVLPIQKNVFKTISVHRLVAIAFLGKSKLYVNHISGNKLDNRIENLEFVNQRENISHNKSTKKNKTSKFIGVSFDKKNNKWMSVIQLNGKSKNLGRFENELDAHNAYLKELEENGITNKYAI